MSADAGVVSIGIPQARRASLTRSNRVVASAKSRCARLARYRLRSLASSRLGPRRLRAIVTGEATPKVIELRRG